MKNSIPIAVLDEQLIAAVSQDKHALVRVLIEQKADVDSKDVEGHTCLHLAVINRNPQMVQALLAAKAKPTVTIQKNGAAFTACWYASCIMQPPAWDCVDAFARNYTEKNGEAKFGASLVTAIEHKKFDTALLLLRANAQTDWHTSAAENTCLHLLALHLDDAVENNRANEIVQITTILQSLRKRGVNLYINAVGQTALELIKSPKSAAIFLKELTFSNAQLVKPLIKAVEQNKYDLARLLIEQKADVNSKDAEGRTCLHLAVINKNSKMVEALLAAKADPTVTILKDGQAYTACWYASYIMQPPAWDCIDVLARNYTETNGKAKFGASLVAAIECKKFDTAILLLQANAQTDWFTSANKNTGLHHLALHLDDAVENNRADEIEQITAVLQLLRKRGVDLAAKNTAGQTAFDLPKADESKALLLDPKCYEMSYRLNDELYKATKLPTELTHLIICYTGEFVKRLQTFQSALYIMNVSAFCQAYYQGWGFRSEASRQFVTKLQNQIEENSLLVCQVQKNVDQVKDQIASFVENNKSTTKNKKPNRAMTLLAKFSILAAPSPSKQESKRDLPTDNRASSSSTASQSLSTSTSSSSSSSSSSSHNGFAFSQTTTMAQSDAEEQKSIQFQK